MPVFLNRLAILGRVSELHEYNRLPQAFDTTFRSTPGLDDGGAVGRFAFLGGDTVYDLSWRLFTGINHNGNTTEYRLAVGV